MSAPIQPIRLEEVDWINLLPWVRIFRGFRMAIHPPKMLVALLLVVLLYCGGKVMDAVWGVPVEPSVGLATGWYEPAPRGIYADTLSQEVHAFDRMVSAATTLKFGFPSLTLSGAYEPDTVIGALRDMIVVIPSALYRAHRWFSLIYCVYGMMVWALLAGAIARMAALHATREQKISAATALRFAAARWLRFFLTPLLPLALILAIGLLLSLGGLVFFNHPLTEMVGGLLFVFALLGGLAITVLLIGLLAGANMIYPAISVDGADALDVLSRIYHYALSRPWRWLFCNVLALVYGAITYLVVGTVIFFSLLVTHWWVELGVVGRTKVGGHMAAIWPMPQFGHLAYGIDFFAALPWPSRTAAALIWVWVFLLIGLLPAYAISYYLCSNTWIYLLLRRASDQTSFDEVYEPMDATPARLPPEATAARGADESAAVAREKTDPA